MNEQSPSKKITFVPRHIPPLALHCDGLLLRPLTVNRNIILHFDEDVEDTISWTLTDNGQYTAAYAYLAQFFGAMPRR
jgi:hypothetical protein